MYSFSTFNGGKIVTLVDDNFIYYVVFDRNDKLLGIILQDAI